MPRKRPKLVEKKSADDLLMKQAPIQFGEKLEISELEAAEEESNCDNNLSNAELNEADKTSINKTKHVYRDEYFVDWDHMTEAQEEAAAAAAAEAQALLEAGAAAPELPRRQSNRKRRSGKEPARTPVRTPPRVERDSSPEVDDDVRIPSRLVLTAAQRKAKEMREKTIASTNMMLEELDQEANEAEEGGDSVIFEIPIEGPDGQVRKFAVDESQIFKFLYKAYAVVTETNPKWIEIRYGEKALDQFETPADIGLDGSQVLTAAYIEDEGKPTHDASKDVVIRVLHSSHEMQEYTIAVDKPFEKLFSVYAEAVGCSEDRLTLLFDGELVGPNTTCVNLDVDEGEEIQFDARIA